MIILKRSISLVNYNEKENFFFFIKKNAFVLYKKKKIKFVNLKKNKIKLLIKF